jgi:hypothetical protein
MLNRIPPGAMFNSRGAQMEFLGVGPVMIR